MNRKLVIDGNTYPNGATNPDLLLFVARGKEEEDHVRLLRKYDREAMVIQKEWYTKGSCLWFDFICAFRTSKIGTCERQSTHKWTSFLLKIGGHVETGKYVNMKHSLMMESIKVTTNL